MRFFAAMTYPENNGTISLIAQYGFDRAVDDAFAKNLENGLNKSEALRYMKISRTCLSEARLYRCSQVVHDRFLLLARFYRKLAHKIYWATKTDSNDQLGFLQEVEW